MTSYRTFSELNLKNHQYKKLAVVSAILLLAVITILVLELIGIRNSSLHMSTSPLSGCSMKRDATGRDTDCPLGDRICGHSTSNEAPVCPSGLP